MNSSHMLLNPFTKFLKEHELIIQMANAFNIFVKDLTKKDALADCQKFLNFT